MSFDSVLEWTIAHIFYWGVVIGTLVLLGGLVIERILDDDQL